MDTKGLDPTDSEVFICASLFPHITRIFHANYNCKEEFEDTKGVIRNRKSKDRQHDGQIKMDNRTGHAINYKTLHINLQIE